MRNVNVVRKEKEKKLYMLDNIKELDNITFSSLIPSNAKKVEITYSDKNKILAIDYIINLSITQKGEPKK